VTCRPAPKSWWRARVGPLVHVWLDTWTGVGLIAAGMARQGYDIGLARYDEQGGA